MLFPVPWQEFADAVDLVVGELLPWNWKANQTA